MNWTIRARRWSVFALATTLLVLSLTLAACGQASQQSGTNGSSSSSTSTSQQSSSANQSSANQGSDNTQIQNADQDVQSTLQSLDNAQNDVTTSSSTQDSGQIP